MITYMAIAIFVYMYLLITVLSNSNIPPYNAARLHIVALGFGILWPITMIAFIIYALNNEYD